MSKHCYVTKYALTKGIEKCEASAIPSSDRYLRAKGYSCTFLKKGKDVFETPEEAVAYAMSARDRKIASLRKQIAKLEKMTFGIDGASGK